MARYDNSRLHRICLKDPDAPVENLIEKEKQEKIKNALKKQMKKDISLNE